MRESYISNLRRYTDCDLCHLEWHETADTMRRIIKSAPRYLIFAFNCRWDGASGYKIASRIEETVGRESSSSIYPVAVSSGGKTLVCLESSHDVPTGATTAIVALTDAEYEKLQYSDFHTVQQFAEKHIRSAKGRKETV